MERRKSQNTKPGAAQAKAATKTEAAQGEEQRREEKNNKQNGNELDAALLPDVAEVFKAVGDFGDGSAGNKGRGEEDDDDFEELFSKFASIKDRASGMSDNERKAYAEKVATSFWMALGGEDDEVGGLDSDTEWRWKFSSAHLTRSRDGLSTNCVLCCALWFCWNIFPMYFVRHFVCVTDYELSMV